MTEQPVIVYFDGACPLCVKEISLLRRLHGERARLVFEDISPPDAVPSCPIDREALLARFHARLPNGSMVEGAQAFTEAWSRIPAFVWLRPVGRFGPTRWVLNKAYSGFLRIRPRLQKFAQRGNA